MKRSPVLAIVIGIGAVAVLTPIILTAAASFGLTAPTVTLSFDGYFDFFIMQPKYLRAFFISLLVAGAVTLGSLIVALPAAFVLAKQQSRITDWIFLLYVVIMVIPFQAMMLPQYILFDGIGLLDSLSSLILPSIFSTFPVFLLTQNLKLLPNDCLEAAALETSNPFIILTHIIIPAIRPAVLSTAVLTFAEVWCQVAEPMTFLESTEKFPLPVVSLLAEEDIIMTATVATVLVVLPLLLYLASSDEIGEMRIKT